jgi:hypothetical protein
MACERIRKSEFLTKRGNITAVFVLEFVAMDTTTNVALGAT